MMDFPMKAINAVKFKSTSTAFEKNLNGCLSFSYALNLLLLCLNKSVVAIVKIGFINMIA